MTLLEYADSGTLDPGAQSTIECLLSSVAWLLEQEDREAIEAIHARNQSDEPMTKLDLGLLGRAFPWISQMKRLNLSRSSPKLQSLEPIRHLPNLKSLNVSNNAIQDLSPLSSLNNLKVLDVSGNPLQSLESLANLRALTELAIDDVPVRDLSPIEQLSNLEELTLGISIIDTFCKCQQLPSLKYLNIQAMFGSGSVESFRQFPSMPKLLEIVGLNVDSLEGLERFPSIVNLTNIEGDFDDLTPLADLPYLTHFNALRCRCSGPEVLTRLSSLRDISIASDQITNVDALVELSRVCEVCINGSYVSDSQYPANESIGESWDKEFLGMQPISTPRLELRIVTQNEFERFDGNESYGIEDWDGNRRMISSEVDWLDNKIGIGLSDFLDNGEDYYLPTQVKYARSTTVVLYSEKAVTVLERVVHEIQRVLCGAKNPWIVYLQSDLYESGSKWPNFIAWVYPDHLQAQELDAERIQRHLRR
ncbi:leucine-rich repeat domain-containing protein [Bremerella sp. JC770]|uniref:leucine-rich repeat domain-containing protein n=1 Tax=Bremerella sp. JC770 TaxID=3232137 RepID=UPI003458EC85